VPYGIVCQDGFVGRNHIDATDCTL